MKKEKEKILWVKHLMKRQIYKEIPDNLVNGPFFTSKTRLIHYTRYVFETSNNNFF